ncbi:MAG: enoyl-CoA hydratase/isomerase family protein [Thermoplasmata archaeon]
MPTGYIKTQKEEGIGILTVDRPPVNAISTEMVREIGEAFKELDNDDDVKVIIITGGGNYAFVAGADVKEMEGIEPDKGYDIVKAGQKVFWEIEHGKKPVIAAINGMALGGGNELAMACDIRIASDRARFGQPEVNLGLFPAYGGTQRLPRLIGKAIAKEMIFTGRTLRAQEALKIGLVNQVVPDGEELRAAKDMAMQIMSKAPVAVRMAKKAIDEGLDVDYEKAFEIEAACFREISKTEDLIEGIKAFLEKRQPNFKGK